MPGIIDAHTHPGLISTGADLSGLDETVGENEEPATPDRMPSRPREATLAWLQQYADDHPFDLVISQGVWDVAAYVPDGPHKRDLDEIASIRPIVLFDNSGHSVWVNSAMLRTLGIDRDTPDLSENLSYIVRDEAGEPTGWLKEFVLTHHTGGKLAPSPDELKERMLKYLNYMSSKGITTLWDAGNFSTEDAVYQAAHDIAREGNLPLRWEGSYHIWTPDQIETAVESLLRLRERYGHGKLQFNTIKIHYDGMLDILTAAVLEPYVTDPDSYGGVLFTPQRLSSFMQELDGHDIDLHLHAAGDRATRNILDAVEQAQGALGRPLKIEVTISHRFLVADRDVKRFAELNVHANFSPHWFGGTFYGKAGEINVGPERASRSQVAGHFVRQQANVTLSSDVVHSPRRVNPFLGMEMSVTRRATDKPDAITLPPLDAGISLEQALAGYTINGAAQLGLEGEVGVIKAGLLADFIVLPQNPFETDVEKIHAIEPSATVVAGAWQTGEPVMRAELVETDWSNGYLDSVHWLKDGPFEAVATYHNGNRDHGFLHIPILWRGSFQKPDDIAWVRQDMEKVLLEDERWNKLPRGQALGNYYPGMVIFCPDRVAAAVVQRNWLQSLTSPAWLLHFLIFVARGKARPV